MKILIMLVSLAAALVAAPLEAQTVTSYKIVVNAGNPVASVSRTQLSQLFLKKVTRWADGRPAMAVDQREESPIRQTFSKTVHGRGVTSIASYWQQQIFSGRGIPPSEKLSDADVLQFVSANTGAVGYVSATADLPASVKVVTIQ